MENLAIKCARSFLIFSQGGLLGDQVCELFVIIVRVSL